VVIAVLLLLQLADHGATAVPTLDQVAEGKVTPNRAGRGSLAPIDNVLSLCPEFARDGRLLLAGVRCPVEVAPVDPIAQNLVTGG
jgi:hypothetical protein